MIFSKKTPDGRTLDQLMFTGEKDVTRRIFERDCKICKKPKTIGLMANFPFGPPDTLCAYCVKMEGTVPVILTTHTRKLIGVGDNLAICPKRAKAAICAECGKPKEAHNPRNLKQMETATTKFSEELLKTPILVCKSDAELMLDQMLVGTGKSTLYQPLKRKVKSIMSHLEWDRQLSIRAYGEGDGTPERWDEEQAKEANREGGPAATWAWLKAALDGRINESWRIEFEPKEA